MSKKQPFYKTGPAFLGIGGIMATDSLDSSSDGNAGTGSVGNQPESSSNTEDKYKNIGSRGTDKNNASLGRSRRQRKIANLKGKLTDVKAQTLDLASKSKKTGDNKEVAQKDAILGKHDQGSRIEKRIARKEGRQERKAIRQSLKGKETRGERRKQIIKSRQGQRKKVKSINNPRS